METFAPYLEALRASDLAAAMRTARWLYPAASAGHILGIALILGAILPFDFRLMGMWRRVPVGPLARVLVPVAQTGIILAVGTGILIFSVDPEKYAAMPLFQVKLGLIALAIVNALALRAARDWPPALGSNFLGTTNRLAWSGGVSAICWLGAMICGRMIAYV